MPIVYDAAAASRPTPPLLLVEEPELDRAYEEFDRAHVRLVATFEQYVEATPDGRRRLRTRGWTAHLRGRLAVLRQAAVFPPQPTGPFGEAA